MFGAEQSERGRADRQSVCTLGSCRRPTDHPSACPSALIRLFPRRGDHAPATACQGDKWPPIFPPTPPLLGNWHHHLYTESAGNVGKRAFIQPIDARRLQRSGASATRRPPVSRCAFRNVATINSLRLFGQYGFWRREHGWLCQYIYIYRREGARAV